MALTKEQLAELRHNMITLVKIDYQHLFDELLDHYATLTEEKMAAGLSFYEASIAAWEQMGDTKRIQRIQTHYEIATRKQIKARYFALLKSLFRWPTVVKTLLMVALLTYLLFLLPQSVAKTVLAVLVMSPLFVSLVASVPYYWDRDSRKKLTFNFINRVANIPVALLQLYNMYRANDADFLASVDVMTLLVLASVNLLLAVSLAQLTREHFFYKPAIGQ